MKEKDITNPTSIGLYHRDILKAVEIRPEKVKILLTCGHFYWLTHEYYNKHYDNAIICIKCSENKINIT